MTTRRRAALKGQRRICRSDVNPQPPRQGLPSCGSHLIRPAVVERQHGFGAPHGEVHPLEPSVPRLAEASDRVHPAKQSAE